MGIKNPGWWGSKSHKSLLTRASPEELENTPDGIILTNMSFFS